MPTKEFPTQIANLLAKKMHDIFGLKDEYTNCNKGPAEWCNGTKGATTTYLVGRRVEDQFITFSNNLHQESITGVTYPNSIEPLIERVLTDITTTTHKA